MHPIDSQNNHFYTIWTFAGISHPCGGLLVPGSVPMATKSKLRHIILEYWALHYIINRVCDLVTWQLLVTYLWPEYRWHLGTIEEDLYNGIDYIVTQWEKQITVDFTTGENGFLQKTAHDRHIVMKVNSILLHGYIRAIAHRMEQGMPFDIAVNEVYRRNRGTFDKKFFWETKWLFSIQ